MSKTFDEACVKAANDIAQLVISKQHDYGPRNILGSVVSPEIAIAVRLNDKIARLVNLVNRDGKPNNESLNDTAMDIMGYGLVLKMVLDGTFELPLKKKK